MFEAHKAQINVVLTEHTLKTGIISEIAQQYTIIIFKLNCRRGDFLGSSAVEHFEGKGLRDWGNQAGFQSADQEVGDWT